MTRHDTDGKPRGKSKIAIQGAKRGTVVFQVEPERLIRVTDPVSPLYHPNASIPVAELEWLVRSIMRGFKPTQALIVRKNGPLLEVVDGRKRHIAVIEANKRLAAQAEAAGVPPVTIKVPVMLEKGTDRAAHETMLVTSYLRQNDDVITAAERVVDYIQKFGASYEDVETMFRLTTATIKNYEKLIALAEPCKRAVRAGKIASHEAVKVFSPMTREEQVAALPAVLESTSTKRQPRAAGSGQLEADSEEELEPGSSSGEREAGGEESAPKIKKESAISRLRRLYRSPEAMEALSKRERALINWMFDKISLGDLQEAIPGLSCLTTKKGKKGRKGKQETTSGKREAGSGKHAATGKGGNHHHGGSRAGFLAPR